MARYYFEINSGGDYPIYDRDGPWEKTGGTPYPRRIGTLHDVILAERVVSMLNDYEHRFDGR